MTPEETQGTDKRFCPYCFMQQFEVTETSAGSVYCEVCGIDVAVKDLVRSVTPLSASAGLLFLACLVCLLPASAVAAQACPEMGWLGISISEVGEELADRLASAFGPATGNGVQVVEVLKGGPAESARLARGDVIVQVDAQPIWDVRQLQRLVRSRPSSGRVVLTVLRRRRTRDASPSRSAPCRSRRGPSSRGSGSAFSVREVSDETRRAGRPRREDCRSPSWMRIRPPRGPASGRWTRSSRVNDQPVRDLEGFARALATLAARRRCSWSGAAHPHPSLPPWSSPVTRPPRAQLSGVGPASAESICLIGCTVISVTRMGCSGIPRAGENARCASDANGDPHEHDRDHCRPARDADPADRVRRLRRLSVQTGSGGPARDPAAPRHAPAPRSPGRAGAERRRRGLPAERPAGGHPDGGLLPAHRGRPVHLRAVAAANSMSDVYAMGGRVLLALNVAGFPREFPREAIARIFQGGADKVAEAGAVIAGGHTVVDKEPKYGLCVTGLVHPDRVMIKGGLVPGHRLFLSKPLGTGVIATAGKGGAAQSAHMDAAIQSMTRLNRGAAEVLADLGVRGCTDVTGFGFLGHASEMVLASGCGFRVRADAVPCSAGAMRYAEQGFFAGGLGRNRTFLRAWRARELALRIAPTVPAVWRTCSSTPRRRAASSSPCRPEAAQRSVRALRRQRRDRLGDRRGHPRGRHRSRLKDAKIEDSATDPGGPCASSAARGWGGAMTASASPSCTTSSSPW